LNIISGETFKDQIIFIIIIIIGYYYFFAATGIFINIRILYLSSLLNHLFADKSRIDLGAGSLTTCKTNSIIRSLKDVKNGRRLKCTNKVHLRLSKNQIFFWYFLVRLIPPSPWKYYVLCIYLYDNLYV